MKSLFPDSLPDRLRKHLEKANRIAILSHINPDGDSIGASLALYLALDSHGFPAEVVVPNGIPAFLSWLPGCEKAIVAEKNPEKAVETVRNAEVLFFIDFSELNRLEMLEDAARQNTGAYRVLIDHHPGPTINAALVISDTTVSSTAELMFTFISMLFPDESLAENIAAALYTGVMTDTGGFSHNIRRPETFRITAELLKTGIDQDEIHSKVYDNFTVTRMKLLGYALHQKMKILPEYHTGYIVLTHDELTSFHFQPGDTEGFVNLPLSVQGIRFSALFLEKEDHIKISFRSKGSFAVNEFSKRYFHGGGHVNAAGGESRDSLGQTLKDFENKIRDHADEI
ncbi:MAG: bifunctional oligoribonuclease/PAP phosphatase NrnA [Chlorobi bacterium]|nr:bifunctional oligoribonuclease/PAP phosphatase NrnA [Chlorobiota bacterium]